MCQDLQARWLRVRLLLVGQLLLYWCAIPFSLYAPHPPMHHPQSLKLLPPQLEPSTVARFLRCCPGLAKPAIGEILGEREAFYEQVREAFMETFDFTGGRLKWAWGLVRMGAGRAVACMQTHDLALQNLTCGALLYCSSHCHL